MLRRLPAAIAFVLACGGCASPTLPLPPPAVPTQGVGPDADHVTLSSSCGGSEPGAILVIVNLNPSVANDLAVSGARADSCGSWDATVYAHKGDVLHVTQDFDTTTSPPVTVVIR
jgi:hypothetical protein